LRFPSANKLRLIRLEWVTAVTLLKLLNEGYKLESLQEDVRTRQEIPQTTGCKARACCVVYVEMWWLHRNGMKCQAMLFQTTAANVKLVVNQQYM